MIRTWFRRRLLAEVHAEAQIDLRDGLLEARADRIAELETANARLVAELATYKAYDYMRQALRLRRRQAEQAEIPARQRAAETPTEVHPRTRRQR